MAVTGGHRTQQEMVDEMTMRIENPNVVGSGYIQFPPQRPFERPLQMQPPTIATKEYQDELIGGGYPQAYQRPAQPQPQYRQPQYQQQYQAPRQPPVQQRAPVQQRPPVQQQQQYQQQRGYQPAMHSQRPPAQHAPQGAPQRRPQTTPQAPVQRAPVAQPMPVAPPPVTRPPVQYATHSVQPPQPVEPESAGGEKMSKSQAKRMRKKLREATA